MSLCLALAGCSSPTPTAPPDNVSPQPATPAPSLATSTPPDVAAVTVTAEPLPTGADNSTSTLPASPAASATPALSVATGTPSPTPGQGCTNNAKFVADVTVPDGTQFTPGQAVDKQWRVRNTGTCDWGPDYRLVLVSGNALGAPSEVALYPAKAGSEAILELSMLAPAQPGPYTGRWQARSPAAKLFGDRVFVTINVVPITATVTLTATATH